MEDRVIPRWQTDENRVLREHTGPVEGLVGVAVHVAHIHREDKREAFVDLTLVLNTSEILHAKDLDLAIFLRMIDIHVDFVCGDEGGW